MNNREGKRPYGIKEGSMPDPDNNSINRQPIIVNLRKRERTYDGQYDAGNSPGTVIVSLYNVEQL